MDSGSIPVGVRRFESGPPHFIIDASQDLRIDDVYRMPKGLDGWTPLLLNPLLPYVFLLQLFKLTFQKVNSTDFSSVRSKQFLLVWNTISQ